MKSQRQIKQALLDLRKIVDNGNITESRMAYVAENAIRWATQKTVGWQSPAEDVIENYFLLIGELENQSTEGSNEQDTPRIGIHAEPSP